MEEGGGYGYGRLVPEIPPHVRLIGLYFSLLAMVASAVKLRRTSDRALYASTQLASIKLCDIAALYNCQLLSKVTQLIE